MVSYKSLCWISMFLQIYPLLQRLRTRRRSNILARLEVSPVHSRSALSLGLSYSTASMHYSSAKCCACHHYPAWKDTPLESATPASACLVVMEKIPVLSKWIRYLNHFIQTTLVLESTQIRIRLGEGKSWSHYISPPVIWVEDRTSWYHNNLCLQIICYRIGMFDVYVFSIYNCRKFTLQSQSPGYIQ